MLAVPKVHHKLLFRPRIETEVRLVREIVRMKEHLNEWRLWHEGLRLLALTTKHARLLPVRYIRLRIPVHNLEQNQNDMLLSSTTWPLSLYVCVCDGIFLNASDL